MYTVNILVNLLQQWSHLDTIETSMSSKTATLSIRLAEAKMAIKRYEVKNDIAQHTDVHM